MRIAVFALLKVLGFFASRCSWYHEFAPYFCSCLYCTLFCKQMQVFVKYFLSVYDLFFLQTLILTFVLKVEFCYNMSK